MPWIRAFSKQCRGKAKANVGGEVGNCAGTAVECFAHPLPTLYKCACAKSLKWESALQTL